MEKERKVFLFGAGSLMDWTKKPSTKNITEAILEIDNFLMKDQKTPIIRYIYDTLIEGKEENQEYLKKSINFETIINVIEELIVHYANFKDGYVSARNDNEISSIHRKVYSSKLGEEIFNFVDGKVDYCSNHSGYGSMEFNGKCISTNFEKKRGETEEQFILQVLLYEVFSTINGIVSKYGYQNSDLKKSNFFCFDFEQINSLFTSAMNQLKGEHHVMRMYSLNYDRMYKTLLESSENSSWQIYDGFDTQGKIDLKNLYMDVGSDCYYNLHGSFFWMVEHKDIHGLDNYEISLSNNMQTFSSETTSIQIQKGRSVLITPIITGYQKAEKLVLTPFRQMQAGFDKDCFLADHIYIIGYSFGDEHINEILRTTAKHNPKAVFHIVDLIDDKDNQLEKVLFSLFTSFQSENGINSTKKNDEIDIFFNGRVILHKNGFKSFLNYIVEEKRKNNVEI